MNRYYLSASAWSFGAGGALSLLELSGDEAKHCARVMRAKVGDLIEVFDGAGRSAVAEIESVSKSEVRCRVLEISHSPKNPHPITLYQAIPKGGNMELIVQKSVELGVAVIQPLMTAHTVVRPDSVGKKRVKWQRIALEACKQCGQNYLPEVRDPLTFSAWMAEPRNGNHDSDNHNHNHGKAIIAALDERAVHLKTLLSESPMVEAEKVSLLVGPEGDFSSEEYKQAYEVGFKPVSFGEIVMRVETATLYGISILQHEISSL